VFFEALAKPDVTIERLVGNDYYRVVHSDLGGGDGSTVVSGIVRGVTFSFDIPGAVAPDEVRALVALVAKGVEENVFLDSGSEPGQDRVGASTRVIAAPPGVVV
jgi:hypothetical protein